MLTPGAEAVQQIIQQSASEILKMYLLDVDKTLRKWSPEQAWLLIKELAKNDAVSGRKTLIYITNRLSS